MYIQVGGHLTVINDMHMIKHSTVNCKFIIYK